MTTLMLDAPQRQRAIEVMREYLDAAPGHDGRTPKQISAQTDQNRVTLIDQTLRPLVLDYLTGAASSLAASSSSAF